MPKLKKALVHDSDNWSHSDLSISDDDDTFYLNIQKANKLHPQLLNASNFDKSKTSKPSNNVKISNKMNKQQNLVPPPPLPIMSSYPDIIEKKFLQYPLHNKTLSEIDISIMKTEIDIIESDIHMKKKDSSFHTNESLVKDKHEDYQNEFKKKPRSYQPITLKQYREMRLNEYVEIPKLKPGKTIHIQILIQTL
jgi:hypothetical protein